MDIKKIIKGLECCMSEKTCEGKCPYKGQCDDGGYYYSKAIEDAIAMLKEQDAKTGHWVGDDGNVVRIDDDGCPERACVCSECKEYLVASDEYAVYGRYCPFCGAKMESW